MSALPTNSVQLGDGAGGFLASAALESTSPGTVNIGTAANPALVELMASNGIIVSIAPPASPTAWTLTLPAGPGNAGDMLTSDGSGDGVWIQPDAGDYSTTTPSSWLVFATAVPTNIRTALDNLATILALIVANGYVTPGNFVTYFNNALTALGGLSASTPISGTLGGEIDTVNGIVTNVVTAT